MTMTLHRNECVRRQTQIKTAMYVVFAKSLHRAGSHVVYQVTEVGIEGAFYSWSQDFLGQLGKTSQRMVTQKITDRDPHAVWSLRSLFK